MKSIVVVVVFLLCCVVGRSIAKRSSVQSRRPIILVPGLGRSRLQMKVSKTDTVDRSSRKHGTKQDEWTDIWLNTSYFVSDTINFTRDFSLHFNLETNKTTNTPGIQIRTVDFGNTSSIEWFSVLHVDLTSYFYDLVNHLVTNRGYERGVSLRGAPYDFRKAPNEQEQFFKDLKKLVEETYRENGKTSVVILGHSLGCLFSLYFLNHQTQQWKNKYIHSFISTSGPYGGAVKMLQFVVSGDNLGLYWIPGKQFNEVERTVTTGSFLIPYRSFWLDEPVVKGPDREYTVNDYEALFDDMQFQVGLRMRQVVEPLIEKLEAPGVEVHCVYSYALNTTEFLTYAAWNTEPQVRVGDGDGEVNIRSLRGCERWIGSNSAKVTVHKLEGVNHRDIVSNQTYFDYVDSVVMIGN